MREVVEQSDEPDNALASLDILSLASRRNGPRLPRWRLELQYSLASQKTADDGGNEFVYLMENADYVMNPCVRRVDKDPVC